MEKKRGMNYSEHEKNFLLSCIERHHNIISSKKYDTISLEVKKKTWEKITQEFNSQVFHQRRSTRQLMVFYHNLKRKPREEIPVERKGVRFVKRLLDFGTTVETVQPVLETTNKRTEALNINQEIKNEFVKTTGQSEEETLFPVQIKKEIDENDDVIIYNDDESIDPLSNGNCHSVEGEEPRDFENTSISSEETVVKLNKRKRKYSIEQLKNVYLRKKIANANLHRKFMIREFNIKMKIYKLELKKLEGRNNK